MNNAQSKPKYTTLQNIRFMVGRSRGKGTRGVPWMCGVIALLTVGVSVTELLITPMILGKVETAAPLMELLLTIAGFTAVLLLLSAAKAYFDQRVQFSRMVVRLGLVDSIHRKFCMTAYPNTEDSRFIARSESINSNIGSTEAIWGTLTDLLRDVLGFAIYLLLLSSLDPLLVLVILVTSVAGFLVNDRINGWGFRHREEESQLWNRLEYVNQRGKDIKLGKDIRVFGMKSWLEDLSQTTGRALYAFLARREGVYFWANVVDAALTFLRSGAAYLVLIGMALNKGLSASEFLLYFTAVSGFATWVTGILNQLSTLRRQSLELSTLREYLDWPDPFTFEGGEDVKIDPAMPCEWKLEHVSFRYPGAEEDTLHDVNLTIPAGEKLAVVGLNGAGKTTLVKLLCGFYDPTVGRVLLNGKDIRQLDRRQYYKLFSAVFQDFSVLETSVEENVAQNFENIDGEKVRGSLEKAGLSEKVKNLPKGLKTVIGHQVYEDGVELSGGETQRLMLARALYKNGPILVLDEPTAALDPIAENDIYQKYNEMTNGRTSVFISHRLASTRFCDRILFIADGSIAEEGTHESLLALGGRYAELFHVQSRYYESSR